MNDHDDLRMTSSRMTGWYTDRMVSWTEWKFHNARFWLIRLLAGKDQIAINLIINRGGNVLTVAPGSRLFAYNNEIAPQSVTSDA